MTNKEIIKEIIKKTNYEHETNIDEINSLLEKERPQYYKEIEIEALMKEKLCIEEKIKELRK